jgi:hypothetical protein
MASKGDVSIQFHVEGFQEKIWMNPTETTHRIYIHKLDGEHKIECGYLDLTGLFYCGPDKRRTHADHNVVLCQDTADITDDMKVLATVKQGDKKTVLYYKGVVAELKPLVKRADSDSIEATPSKTTEEIPIPVVDAVKISPTSQNPLEHIASITQCDTKITISYGNTVEVKSRNRGLIQSQYPKFSLTVEMDGGNVFGHISEAADAVVKLVEDRLTEIVKELSGNK